MILKKMAGACQVKDTYSDALWDMRSRNALGVQSGAQVKHVAQGRVGGRARPRHPMARPEKVHKRREDRGAPLASLSFSRLLICFIKLRRTSLPHKFPLL
jgi:hypothetical protein